MLETIKSKHTLDSSDTLRIRGDSAGSLAVVKQAVKDKLSPEKISEDIEDKEFVTLLGIGARATFSELVSLLEEKKTPWGVHAEATKILSTIGRDAYTNDEFRAGIKDIVVDDQGEEYYFDLEMARDVAEFLVAVSVIFPGEQAERLHSIALIIWNGITFHSHKIPSQRSFFNLERSRFLYQIGRKEDIYWPGAVENLQEFFDTHTKIENNTLIITHKDKVASVLARAHELGQALGCEELESLAKSLLEKVAAVDLAYADAAEKEHAKATKAQERKKIMNVLAPLSNLPGKRQKLIAEIKEFGVNQRDRLGIARV